LGIGHELRSTGRNAGAIGGIAGQLERALFIQIAKGAANQGGHIGKHLGCNGGILIGRDAKIIRYRHADAVHCIKFDVRHKHTAAIFVANRV